MELTYFYKAEMPRLKNQTLNMSKLKILKWVSKWQFLL